MKKKAKKKKLLKINRLIKKVDSVFNRYIRLRDGKCIITKVKFDLQCSHYYPKKYYPALRWNEKNAHAMNKKIHFKHHHGGEALYALWMFTHYTMEEMKQLNTKSKKKINIYNRIYLMKTLNKYLRKIKELEE